MIATTPLTGVVSVRGELSALGPNPMLTATKFFKAVELLRNFSARSNRKASLSVRFQNRQLFDMKP